MTMKESVWTMAKIDGEIFSNEVFSWCYQLQKLNTLHCTHNPRGKIIFNMKISSFFLVSIVII